MPSFVSVCRVYADVPGGVFNCHGFSAKQLGTATIGVSFNRRRLWLIQSTSSSLKREKWTMQIPAGTIP